MNLRMPLAFLLLVVAALCSVADAEKKVCYQKYGCFNNSPPFDNRFLVPLPQALNEIGTSFHLYTKADTSSSLVIDDNDVGRLQASGYDGSKQTIILIHGWTEDIDNSKWIISLRTAFLGSSRFDGLNLIVVDWGEGADEFYPQSVANTRVVGAQVTELIKFLNQQTENSPGSFHVIGFSLGAHVAGYAGKRLNGKLARISGLDPASVYFIDEEPDVRLDPTDAIFVDVIHSCMYGLGTTTKSGDIDFYPNGGIQQPGCEMEKVGLNSISCNHARAPKLFIESINSQPPMRAFPCSSWAQFTRGNCMTCGSTGCNEMGYNFNANSKGNFYLYTNAQSPFSVFQYVLMTFKTRTGWLSGGKNPGIRIYGNKGNSGKIALEKRALKPGTTERFVAPLKESLGILTMVDVWHFKGKYNPWKLKKVVIELLPAHEKYSACFNINVYDRVKQKKLEFGDRAC